MRLVTIAAAVLVPLTLRADWLVLKDGRELRGIDVTRKGERYQITLESATTVVVRAVDVASVRKSPPGETVEHDGRRMTLREKVRAVALERKKRDRRVFDSLAVWAREKPGAEAAKAAFKHLSESEQTRYLTTAVLEDRRKAVRVLAARELLGAEKDAAIRALSTAAVKDSYRSVRHASLRSLRRFRDFDPSLELSSGFTPYLASPSPAHRVRAANAISLFPSRDAVPVLLKSMHLTWSGFGRAFFSQVTQRSYIADYELVSGGTGFSIVEVADPIVRTLSTGVALDVDVRKVELIARMRALVRASGGQDFGFDFKRWHAWWKAEQAKGSRGAEKL